jgi:hypothetical protein
VCRFGEERGGYGGHGRVHSAPDDRSNNRSTQGSK